MLSLSRFLLFIPFFLFCDVELKREYCFNKDTIFLNDIVKDANSSKPFFKFHTSKYQIQSKKIISALKDVDINASSNYPIILFKKNCDIYFPKKYLELKIKKSFKEKYKDIEIKKVEVEPKHELKFEIKKAYIKDIILNNNSFKRSKGSFYITYNKDRERRVYFDYKLIAYITLLKTDIALQKGDVLKKGDVSVKKELFKRLRGTPLEISQIEKVMLKRYLPEGKIVYKKDVTNKTLIKKGDALKAIIKDGSVELEFDVVSIDDGNLKDIIRVRKSNGKQYRAIIISKDRVLIK